MDNTKAVRRGTFHCLDWFTSCVMLGGGADEQGSLSQGCSDHYGLDDWGWFCSTPRMFLLAFWYDRYFNLLKTKRNLLYMWN